MTTRQFSLIVVFIVGLLLCASASATTYYVAANGVDLNNGTSKGTPWAHLPGMQTWTGTYTPVAGDTFILRGCDTWGNANFPIHWKWSGSAENVITIDRDTAWYNTTNCASAWNRAVFDAGNTTINAPETCPSSMGLHYFLFVDGANYVTFKWIEAKNFYWNVDTNNTCWGADGNIETNNSDNLIFDNWYFHHWTHGASATENIALIGRSASKCTHCVLSSAVIDNSDGDGADCPGQTAIVHGQTCSGGGVGSFSLINSICANVVNCFLGYGFPGATIDIGGNNFYNVAEGFSTQHGNVIETAGVVGSGTVTFLIHDNYIHNVYGVEAMQIGNPNEVDYAWNNVIDADPVANGPQIPQNTAGAGSIYIWNNTIRYSAGCVIAGGHSTLFTALQIQNNHCINDALIDVAFPGGAVPGAVVSNDVVMTNSTAKSQGYTAASRYSPTSISNSTVGAGTDLTSTSPGCGTTGLSGLCNGTSYGGVTEQVVNGVVTAVQTPAIAIARSSNWDAGAYQYSSTVAAKPNAPTGLSALVR